MSSAVSQFVQQWTLLSDPVQFARQLAPDGELMCQLLAADQHLRWRQNSPRPIDYYLKHWPDRRADSFSIGRQKRTESHPDSGCDLVIRCTSPPEMSLKISRQHLLLYRQGESTYVVNQGKVGSGINGHHLAAGVPVAIRAGDRLSIAGMLTIEILDRKPTLPDTSLQREHVMHFPEGNLTFKFEAAQGELVIAPRINRLQ